MLNAFTSPKMASNPLPHVQDLLVGIDWMSGLLRLDVAQIVDIEFLRSLSPGTFGRAWADFLDERQFQAFTTGPRRKQLHDGIHVLTGYGTDAIGEAELQAFLLGAKLRSVNLMLLISLARALHQEQRCYITWKRLWAAYQRGRISLFDPDDWQPELLWELPLDQVQALFRV